GKKLPVLVINYHEKENEFEEAKARYRASLGIARFDGTYKYVGDKTFAQAMDAIEEFLASDTSNA
ncbi:MAG: hypothetical protein ACYC08_00595, partial [Armatimonadota bacterium]